MVYGYCIIPDNIMRPFTFDGVGRDRPPTTREKSQVSPSFNEKVWGTAISLEEACGDAKGVVGRGNEII